MFQIQREREKLVKLANNSNIPSTSSIPTFVPRITIVATYTQKTQTPSIRSTYSTVQTNTQTLQTHTQTQAFQRTISTQTSPPQLSWAVQTEHMMDYTLRTDSTDSGISPDVMDESPQPSRSSRKRKMHGSDHSSNKKKEGE